jgi:hypothetical protein
MRALLEMLCEVHECQAMIFYLQTDYESSDRVFGVILGAAEQIGGWYFREKRALGHREESHDPEVPSGRHALAGRIACPL